MSFSRMVQRACVSLVVVAAAGHAQVAKMPPNYLAEVPEPSAVVATFTQPDSLDRLARQHGALRAIEDMVRLLSWERIHEDNLNHRRSVDQTPDERRIMQVYADVETHLSQPTYLEKGTMESPWAKWVGARDSYGFDKGFRDELLKTFFSPEWRTGYWAVIKDQDAAVAAAKTRTKAEAAEAAASQAAPPERKSSSFSLASVIGAAILLLGVWVAYSRIARQRLEHRLDSVARTFFKPGGATSFSVRNLSVAVDKDARVITVNGLTISPRDFKFEVQELEKAVATGGGSHQPVVGGGGGSVWVPGPVHVHMERAGYMVTVGSMGPPENVHRLKFSMAEEHTFNAVGTMLSAVRSWAQQESNQDAEQVAKRALNDIWREAGLNDPFWRARWDTNGTVRELIATDRSGTATMVYESGKSRWTGSLRGSAASINGSALELCVDDPSFRQQFLKERRFTILSGQPRDILVEWCDRINLLAKQPT